MFLRDACSCTKASIFRSCPSRMSAHPLPALRGHPLSPRPDFSGRRGLPKCRVHLLREVLLHSEHVGKLDEGPAAEASETIDAGNPVSLHGRLLLLGVLAAITLNLHHKMQRIIG